MAGRLANMRFLAQRVMAPKAVLPVRGEGGGPVKMGRTIDQAVSVRERCRAPCTNSLRVSRLFSALSSPLSFAYCEGVSTCLPRVTSISVNYHAEAVMIIFMCLCSFLSTMSFCGTMALHSQSTASTSSPWFPRCAYIFC